MILLGGVGAWCVWPRADRAPARTIAPSATSAASISVTVPTQPALAAVVTNAPALPSAAARLDRLAKYRLSNTPLGLDELLRRDSALVLENARWDVTQPLALKIPPHLRAQGDPGAYLVKSGGPVDEAFRTRLRAAGLTLVSYFPHDAWLVQGSQAQVAAVSGQPGVQAVVPFEPYFKIKSSLLPLAVEQQPLPVGTYLNLVLFAAGKADTLRALAGLGISILGESPSPFGPVVTVQSRPDGLVSLAQLPGVQLIERAAPRATANDLTRVKMGVATDTLVTSNYFGLTGMNVIVALADSGVDMTHPDLVGRVSANSPLSGVDANGHGTHVAGIIAGSGAASGTVPPTPPGSVTGANYRGKAPAAKLFSLVLGEVPVGGLGFDAYAQQQIAQTNALISNNSWGYEKDFDYDIAAASYDASVRDALPLQMGSQPVLSVFAAGPDGGGDGDGLNGIAGSVRSPGTGKNVITVGALEQFRDITNEVAVAGVTNAVWQRLTDSDNQVLVTSARGNVGIGVEGEFGRFKPDVVAPGTFVISTRSSQWDEGAYYSPTNVLRNVFENQTVQPGILNQYSISVPADAIGLRIIVTPTALSSNAFTNLLVYVSTVGAATSTDPARTNVFSIPPDITPLTPGSGYFYAIGNPSSSTVAYTVTTEITFTNNLADYFRVLRQLNDALGPRYRYESGSSMGAAAVSGLLALMQEFYGQRMGRTNSPALMKALLINGARSASSLYDLQVKNTVNHQGWGLPNLPTSLPPTTNVAAANTAFYFLDQSPTNALATGDSVTRTLTLNTNAQGRPLRFTLVWTDPPGNPAAGVKLVNDLDLIVTNLSNGAVYFGNDIPANSDFTAAWATNAAPNRDLVNNVENVYLVQPGGVNLSVTVRARRVNVNAVTAHTNNIVQDYALVISSGDGEVTSAFTLVDAPAVSARADNVLVLTNTGTFGQLLNQTVGANSPLIAALNGITNQWQFYVITNTGTNANFTNAAFLTFLPPTLSVPRLGVQAAARDEYSRPEADIDMYVSVNPALTNLDAAVLAGAARSVGRGGSEIVTLSTSLPGLVYFVGVKSEDAMGAQFNFTSFFTDQPLDQTDADGNIYPFAGGLPALIPDGTPNNPGRVFINAITTSTKPIKIRRVVVTNTITHQNFGDLLSNLSYNNSFSVLHNHTFGNGNFTQLFAYDDSGQGDIPGSKKSDGPGSLQNFVGLDGNNSWLLTVLDDSPNSTGRVENLSIKIEPQDLEGNGDVLTIQPFSWTYDFIEVPAGATNLYFGMTWLSASTLPVDLYVRRGAFPTFTAYDQKATINPPGGTNVLSISTGDIPPLQAGLYYIGIFNPNGIAQTVRLKAKIELDLTGIVPVVFQSTNHVPLLDDAVTIAQQFVTNDQVIVATEVGLRINHPRVSDLAIQLESPSGKRVLLFENRGGASTNGLGADLQSTNLFAFGSGTNSGPAAVTNVIATGASQGVIRINYDFQTIPDSLTVYYETNTIFPTTFFTNTGVLDIPYGPGASNNVVVVINQGGNADSNTVWSFTVTTPPLGYLNAVFTEDTNKVSQPLNLLKFVTPPFNVPNYTGTNAALSNKIFYLPEEDLAAFKGDNALGTWKLEVWDSRVGATNPAPELLAWDLTFLFEKKVVAPIYVPPFTTLTNTVPANSFQYLIVDVPPWATSDTNLLLTATAPLFVWFNQNIAPTGTNPPDTLFYGPVTNGTYALNIAGVPPPPLLPGQSYYVGVQNTNAVAVTYTYRVDYNLTALTNGVPFSDVTASNGIPRYFTYDVSASASAVVFDLFGMNGNLNLVARQGTPLPTLFSYDYGSFNFGVTDEQILVFTNGAPVALRPGVWYLGVFNATATAVNYTIQATEITNAFPAIITLTNGLPYANVNNGAPGTAQFYHYVVTSSAARVQFETFGATGDFTLVARKGLPLPNLLSYDFRSANPGTNDELIIITTNSAPVTLTFGDWFITAVKISGGPASYNIMATEWSVTGQPIRPVISLPGGGDFCFTWESLPGAHYLVQSTPSFGPPVWVDQTNLTAIDFTTTWCTPMTGPMRFFRVIEGISLVATPPPSVSIASVTRGPGGTTLTWFAPVNATFHVQWTDTLFPPTWNTVAAPVVSTTGIFTFLDDGIVTAPFGPFRFYRLVQP